MTTQQSDTYDILVIGGGPAGIGAAVAAARMGRSVALVERYPVLGGMGTAALVSNFCSAHWDGKRLIIGGVFGDLRNRLLARNALFVTGCLEPYDPEVCAAEARAMCEEAGVTLLLDQRVREARFTPGRVTVELESGRRLAGRTLVDASGDAAIAAGAGVPFTFGRPGDGLVMPLTYCYTLGPIDMDTIMLELPEVVREDRRTGEKYLYIGGQARVTEWVKIARQRGELTIPRDRIAVAFSLPGRPGEICVNFGRVFVKDPTDPVQIAMAEEEGKHQVAEGVAFFRKYVPGCANVELRELARQIGVRESRQIRGLYTLTADDVLGCRQFDDVIAQCRYAIDIHSPDGATTIMKGLPIGQHYDIPWRCMIPVEGPENLVVAGRSISATHEAMSSFRVTPSVMAIGEAAGVTAAYAAANGAVIRHVDPKAVQARLLETNGILK